jgi:hypothetical protein
MDETDEGKNTFACKVELEIKGERKDEKMVGGDMGIAADDR